MLRYLVYICILTIVAFAVLAVASHVGQSRGPLSFQIPRVVFHSWSEDESIRTVFVGDIMLDRAVAREARTRGKEGVFAGITSLFQGADAVIGNFEGTMSTRNSIAIPGSSTLRFTFDPTFAPILKQAGFTAVSLANNHSLDFGHAADTETREYIHAADILTFGSALNSKELSTVIPIKHEAFCMVGYHDLFVPDPTQVLHEIESIRPTCSRVVVFVHWGSEYTHVPSTRQRLLAQSFIDTGADLVIGAHPHVVQPVEIYKGKAIFYSLGNFVFDQNFSFATMHGLLVDIAWDTDSTHFKLIPVAINKGQVSVAQDVARMRVLDTAIGQDLDPTIAAAIRTTGEFSLENL
jgi:poly-gamma-glutamate capsule biosynthesis protein CapA/YwtB (metallophosphatase superfamily)